MIIGFNRLGGIKQLTEALTKRGYGRVVAIVNQPSVLRDLSTLPGLFFARGGRSLSARAIYQTACAIEGFGPSSPFLCLQDRPMLAYLSVLDKLGRTQRVPWVPVDGIRNSRLKPRARELWDAAGIAGPAWTIVTGCRRADCEWAKRTGFHPSKSKSYVIKPVDGMSSEYVTRAEGFEKARREASRIRTALLRARKGTQHDGRVSIAGRDYVPSRDLLIEEEIEGPEYTVDGFVQDGVVRAAVQHKETRQRAPFFGDGLIVSPPDPNRGGTRPQAPFEASRHSGASAKQFKDVVARGLAAIRLSNWTFHAEMIVRGGVPMFVELNPRPPGGLLWQTAGLHLGVDLFDACVDLHLGEEVIARPKRCVTGQFPIYADRIGKFERLTGRDEALRVPGVHDIRSAIPEGGVRVTGLDRENYLAFVSIACRHHKAVRDVSKRVKALLTVHTNAERKAPTT